MFFKHVQVFREKGELSKLIFERLIWQAVTEEEIILRKWWITGLPLMFTEYLTEIMCYSWGYGELLTVTVIIHIPRRFKPFSQKSTQECMEFWHNHCKWSAHSQSLYTNAVTFTKDNRGDDRQLYSCALENQNDTNKNHLQYTFSVSVYVKLLTVSLLAHLWLNTT